MVTGYTTIDRIFSKINRDYGIKPAESDLIEWTGEALEAMSVSRLHQENVAFIEVKNFTCELPNLLTSIIQVAKDNHWDESDTKNTGLCPIDVIKEKAEENSESSGMTMDEWKAQFPIYIDCFGMPLMDYELAFYRPFFDLQWGFPEWNKNNLFRSRFTPIRLTQNSFFNSIVCDTNEFRDNSRDEYNIINGNMLRFNFQSGMIALSYLKYRVDEKTGYPMVPDHEIYTTAISAYIIYKYSNREFYAGREGSSQRVQKAEVDWQWYCKRASNHAMMPQSIDELQNILDQRSYLVPRDNRYFGFFGKLNTPENRSFLKNR